MHHQLSCYEPSAVLLCTINCRVMHHQRSVMHHQLSFYAPSAVLLCTINCPLMHHQLSCYAPSAVLLCTISCPVMHHQLSCYAPSTVLLCTINCSNRLIFFFNCLTHLFRRLFLLSFLFHSLSLCWAFLCYVCCLLLSPVSFQSSSSIPVQANTPQAERGSAVVAVQASLVSAALCFAQRIYV